MRSEYEPIIKIDFAVARLDNLSSAVVHKQCASGFCSSKSPVVKWLKHGYLCMFIPGHGPPKDITIFMDVLRKPGPEVCTDHQRITGIYTPDELKF